MSNPITTHAAIMNNIWFNGFRPKFPLKWQKLSKAALIEAYLTSALQDMTSLTLD